MRFLRRLAGTRAGWKTFIFEVMIVVFGVVIALLANHFVTQLNRRAEMLEMMKGVEADLLSIAQVASERLAVEPCRLEQETSLLTLLQRDDLYWQPEVSASLNTGFDDQAVPSVLRMPLRFWPVAAWQAAMSSEGSFALDRAQYSLLNFVFETAEVVNLSMEDLRQKRAELSHLAIGGEITPAQRRDAISLLADISSQEALMATMVREAREAIVSFAVFQTDAMVSDFEFDADQASLAVQEMISTGHEIYGECLQAGEYEPMIKLYERLLGEEIDRSFLENATDKVSE